MLGTPTTPSARKRSIAPVLELLEARQLLASKPTAQVFVTEIASGSNYTLLVVGTSKNDSILITDNGKQAAGSVAVSANGNVNYVTLHPISSIEVITGSGNDKVDYELQGDLQPTVSELLIATSGGQSPLSPKPIKGGGTLQTTVDIVGKVTAGSQLTVLAAPDPRAATTLNVNDSGEIDGRLAVAVESLTNPGSKKLGPINFKFNSTATIGTTGSVATGALAGSSRNVLTMNYNGTNNGDLSVLEEGHGAKDVITAIIQMDPTSTGTVGAMQDAVGGDGTSPKVTFLISRGADSTTKTKINAVISTSSRKSVSVHTGNVVPLTSGKDSTVV